MRFYTKYIGPNLGKIEKDAYADLSLDKLPGCQSIMGIQIENLLLKNRILLLKEINLKFDDIAADNSYIQKATKRHQGCQIDYLVQTYTKNIFIYEFKFNKRESGLEIIEEVKEKIDRLTIPKGYGKIPVLIHFGGVKNAVHDKGYFYRIIDMNDLMEGIIYS